MDSHNESCTDVHDVSCTDIESDINANDERPVTSAADTTALFESSVETAVETAVETSAEATVLETAVSTATSGEETTIERSRESRDSTEQHETIETTVDVENDDGSLSLAEPVNTRTPRSTSPEGGDPALTRVTRKRGKRQHEVSPRLLVKPLSDLTKETNVKTRSSRQKNSVSLVSRLLGMIRPIRREGRVILDKSNHIYYDTKSSIFLNIPANVNVTRGIRKELNWMMGDITEQLFNQRKKVGQVTTLKPAGLGDDRYFFGIVDRTKEEDPTDWEAYEEGLREVKRQALDLNLVFLSTVRLPVSDLSRTWIDMATVLNRIFSDTNIEIRLFWDA